MAPTTDCSGLITSRILFADDDAHFREALADVLRRAGFDCRCASSSDEVINEVRTSRFDALLADIHMPGNRRLELVEQTTRITDGLPVVLLTGQPAVETAARALRLPVMGYFVKPPDFNELFAVLRLAVQVNHNRQAIQAQRQRLRLWDAELHDIENRLRADTSATSGDTDNRFLRLTLRNLILTLADLERSMPAIPVAQPPANAPQHAELLAALRRTVTVLEKTKQHFKSKDLGMLRQELSQLLESR